MKKNYFLCSEAVIDIIKPEEYSLPFKSGYEFDKDHNYYIAVLNFEEIEDKAQNALRGNDDFWLQELVPGLMDVSDFTLKGIKENGLFSEIESNLGLTATRNQAMTIYNLAERYSQTPIEFINEYASKFKVKQM